NNTPVSHCAMLLFCTSTPYTPIHPLTLHDALPISLHKHQVLVVHHVFRPDTTQQILDVGTLLPLHATAVGKALMAFDPLAVPEETLAPAEADRAPVSLPSFTKQIGRASCRERG